MHINFVENGENMQAIAFEKEALIFFLILGDGGGKEWTFTFVLDFCIGRKSLFHY